MLSIFLVNVRRRIPTDSRSTMPTMPGVEQGKVSFLKLLIALLLTSNLQCLKNTQKSLILQLLLVTQQH